VLFIVSDWCEIKDWSKSFDSRGWSKCSPTSPYIKGLRRGKNLLGLLDWIYLLEEAKCCAVFENVQSNCMEEDWSASFDRYNI
jgi:hypothetical protein